MESLNIIGSGVYTITPDINLGVQIENIQWNIPPASLGSASPTLTITGSDSTSVSYSTDMSVDLRFNPDVTLTFTTTNIENTWSCLVKYIYYGDQTAWQNLNTHRANMAYLQPHWTRL